MIECRSNIREENAMPIPRRDASKLIACLSVTLMAAACPRMASATLGEPESSVQTDAAQIRGSLKAMTDHQVYRVHEITMLSGTLLREFVSPDGKVFAVAWKGPTMPDLRQTLGQYYDKLVPLSKLSHADHNHLQVVQDDIVYQVSGHMRAFSGRAYIPGAVPAGVDLGDLH
jgi:hypothetical protein